MAKNDYVCIVVIANATKETLLRAIDKTKPTLSRLCFLLYKQLTLMLFRQNFSDG